MSRVAPYFAILAIMAAPLCGLAQESPTDAGVYSLSGSIGYVESLDGDNFNRELTFAPSVMYFVARDLALGLSVSYHHLGADDRNQDNYAVGPSLRWYLHSEGSKPFASAGLRYGKIDVDFDKRPDVDSDYWEGDVRFGIDVFLSRNVAIETTIGYTYFDVDGEVEFINGDSNSLAFQIGINVFIF